MPVLIVARILQGISAAVVWTIGLALVLDTVGPDNLGKTIGSVSIELTVLRDASWLMRVDFWVHLDWRAGGSGSGRCHL